MRAAVTMRRGRDEHGLFRDMLEGAYTRYFASLGLDLVPVPNDIPDPVRFIEDSRASLLILSGGEDIDEAPEEGYRRDEVETALLRRAADPPLPVLGICRGMQVIARHFGGPVPAEIPPASPHPGKAGVSHPIRILDEEFLSPAGDPPARVNSYHNRYIPEDLLPQPLAAVAVAPGCDVVEALRHRDLPILGIQWHPERPGSDEGFDASLIRAFISGRLWGR